MYIILLENELQKHLTLNYQKNLKNWPKLLLITVYLMCTYKYFRFFSNSNKKCIWSKRVAFVPPQKFFHSHKVALHLFNTDSDNFLFFYKMYRSRIVHMYVLTIRSNNNSSKNILKLHACTYRCTYCTRRM